MYFVYLFTFSLSCWILEAQGKPLEHSIVPLDDTPLESDGETKIRTCKVVEPLDVDDVEILKGGDVFIKAYNATIHAASSELKTGNLDICFNRSMELKEEIFKKCLKWMYEPDEFTILDNGSLLLYGDIIEPGTYEFFDSNMMMCAIEVSDYDDNSGISPFPRPQSNQDRVFIYIGKIGSSISIIALMAHLVTFCLVPSLRNLPGYNLASLCVAFLFAYSFVLIGQIPEVLGVFCVVSGVLQQNFFLVAFFCMNVMAIDIWKTLRLATRKLAINSDEVKKRQFIIYTIYSWGAPLLITTISVVTDNIKGVPDWIRPQFGRDDTCWMNNNTAKAVFFSIPAFTLFMVNGVLFVLSAFIIQNNTMKSTNDQQKQTVRLHFVLYVRLGLMMGVTWLLGVLAAVFGNRVLWLMSDTLNSLQGLFVFLLFTCSRKVFNSLKEKVNSTASKVTTVIKQTSTST